MGKRLSWRVLPRAADAAFYSGLALYTATFALLAVLRHQALNSHSYDLAIYDQVVWNLSQGRWFQTSLEYYFYNFLGDHLSLALAFLAPLYRLYPDPSLLLVLQPLALALAGIPVYWWARERLGHGPALALGLAYLLFTPTIFVIAIDFHDVVLAAPLISFAAYFMLKGDARRFALFAFPALLVKEDVGFIVAALGLYWLLARRQWALGLGTAALGLGWVLVATQWVIPSFNPEGQYYYLGRFASLGSSPWDILLGLFTRPEQAWAHVATPEKLRYVLHLLVPLGFLPLLAPGLLALAVPTLGYLLLRGESPAFLIITQYAAPIVPLLFFATAGAMARVGKAAALATLVLVASGASYYLQSPGPLSRNFVPERYTVSPRAALGKELLGRIPSQAGVVAQSDLAPHLSRRERVYMFPEVPSYDGVDYILLDRQGNRYPLAFSEEAYEEAVAEVLADPHFRVQEERDGYLLLKKVEEKPAPLMAVLGGQARLYGYLLRGASAPGSSLALSLYWEALAPLSEDYSLFLHLVDGQGKRLAQWDGPPLGPYLPTSRWRPGRQLRGSYTLPLPSESGSGRYRLEVGLYDWKTLERLPVADSQAHPQGDSVAIPVP